jgi:hypothetical protein
MRDVATERFTHDPFGGSDEHQSTYLQNTKSERQKGKIRMRPSGYSIAQVTQQVAT